MSLANRLVKGVKIKGLFPLISKGQDASLGSWSYDSSWLRDNTLTFYAGSNEGTNRVWLLPYKREANASAIVQGREVISGEFTGCIMSIYKSGGIKQVNHVDTEPDSDGNKPMKDAWEAQKGGDGFELINEFSTTGVIGNYLGSLAPKQLKKLGAGIVMLCMATGDTIICAIVERNMGSGDYKILDVRQQLAD